MSNLIHYQHPLVDELDSLVEKITTLTNFMSISIFGGLSEEEQDLLRLQLETMNIYAGVLRLRIAAT